MDVSSRKSNNTVINTELVKFIHYSQLSETEQNHLEWFLDSAASPCFLFSTNNKNGVIEVRGKDDSTYCVNLEH